MTPRDSAAQFRCLTSLVVFFLCFCLCAVLAVGSASHGASASSPPPTADEPASSATAEPLFINASLILDPRFASRTVRFIGRFVGDESAGKKKRLLRFRTSGQTLRFTYSGKPLSIDSNSIYEVTVHLPKKQSEKPPPKNLPSGVTPKPPKHGIIDGEIRQLQPLVDWNDERVAAFNTLVQYMHQNGSKDAPTQANMLRALLFAGVNIDDANGFNIPLQKTTYKFFYHFSGRLASTHQYHYDQHWKLNRERVALACFARTLQHQVCTSIAISSDGTTLLIFTNHREYILSLDDIDDTRSAQTILNDELHATTVIPFSDLTKTLVKHLIELMRSTMSTSADFSPPAHDTPRYANRTRFLQQCLLRAYVYCTKEKDNVNFKEDRQFSIADSDGRLSRWIGDLVATLISKYSNSDGCLQPDHYDENQLRNDIRFLIKKKGFLRPEYAPASMRSRPPNATEERYNKPKYRPGLLPATRLQRQALPKQRQKPDKFKSLNDFFEVFIALCQLEQYVCDPSVPDSESPLKAFLRKASNRSKSHQREAAQFINQSEHVHHTSPGFKHGVHTEMRKFRLLQSLGFEPKNMVFFISKLCCPICKLVLESAGVSIAGGHGNIYPWPLDSQMAADDGFMRLLLGDQLFDNAEYGWNAMKGIRCSDVGIPLKDNPLVAHLLIEHAASILQVRSANQTLRTKTDQLLQDLHLHDIPDLITLLLNQNDEGAWKHTLS